MTDGELLDLIKSQGCKRTAIICPECSGRGFWYDRWDDRKLCEECKGDRMVVEVEYSFYRTFSIHDKRFGLENIDDLIVRESKNLLEK